MSSALDRLNGLPSDEAEARLLACCGSTEWARRVAAARPYASAGELEEAADRVWRSLPEEAWLEAFAAHPRIGAPKNGAPKKGTALRKGTDLFSDSREIRKINPSPFSREEQSGVESASPETLANLADANRDYEKRFGWIFIVCASGKTAAEMLALARARIHNDPQTELAIAAEEQRKITRLRIAKLLEAEVP